MLSVCFRSNSLFAVVKDKNKTITLLNLQTDINFVAAITTSFYFYLNFIHLGIFRTFFSGDYIKIVFNIFAISE